MTTEPMPDGRLDDIAAALEVTGGPTVAHELYAEVVRLRAHLVVEQLATEAAETENDRLRAWLSGLGQEWGVRYPGWYEGEQDPVDFCDDQLDAQLHAASQPNTPTVVVSRLAGPWCSSAADACRNCGSTERVMGDPPLCANCAVYGAGIRADGDGSTTFLLLPQGQSAEQAVTAQRERADQAQYELVYARLEIAKLRVVAGAMLRTFTKDAGLRRAAKRSVPVPVTDIERWRAVVHPRRECAVADGHSLVGETEQENHG